MKKILLISLMLAFSSIGMAQNSTAIEGKWVLEGFSNTLYILEDGLKYTYYCSSSNCDSLFNTYEAADGNHLPGVNNYTYINDSIVIDLNFDNFFEAGVSFQCDGNVVVFNNSNSGRWIRLGTSIDDCKSVAVNTHQEQNGMSIYPNPSADIFNFSFDNNINGEIFIYDLLGQKVFGEKINGQSFTINLAHLSKGTYNVRLKTNQGVQYKKIMID
jgi:hypothetical protein